MIRDNKRIQGIHINNTHNVLGQYADDTDATLKAEQDTLDEVLNCLEIFKNATGCAINYDKTQLFRIGSLAYSDFTLITQRKIAWTSEPINVLGIWISHSVEELFDLNYTPLVSKIKGILSLWINRGLSLIGRVNVVNTLIASLFVYKMMVLPTIPEKIVKQVETEINKFLWSGSKPKIALRTLQRPKKSGGLNLVNLRKKDKALKISWIQLLYDNDAMSNIAFHFISPVMRQWIFDCNLKKEHVKTLQISNMFWENVLEAWSEINYKDIDATDDPIIWFNSDILISNKPFFWEKAFLKGLFRVSQLYEEGRLISVKTAYQRFDINYLELHSLISAIPAHTKKTLSMGKPTQIRSMYSDCLDKKHITKYVYLLLNQVEPPLEKIEKWNICLHIDLSIQDYYAMFNNVYIITNVPKYRSFQYRLLHHALITNIQLRRWGIKQTELCTFCEKYVESTVHLMWECEFVQTIWQNVETYINRYNIALTEFNVKNVMLNTVAFNTANVKNFLCLVTKQYIYRKKCENKRPMFEELKSIFIFIECVEKFIAIKNNNLGKHFLKWHMVSPNTHNVDD